MSKHVVFNNIGRNGNDVVCRGTFYECEAYLKDKQVSQSSDSAWIDIKKQMPDNGREVLINTKDDSGQEKVVLGFYACEGCVGTDENAEVSVYHEESKTYSLQEGWYQKVYNHSKFDCFKINDVKVSSWSKLHHSINLETITYAMYMELCIVSRASSYKESENWLNHYWVLDSDRYNIEL